MTLQEHPGHIEFAGENSDIESRLREVIAPWASSIERPPFY